MVSTLDRKLFRELKELMGQAITIAAIVMCGIASYVTLYSTYLSIESARDNYYESHRFADVFSHLKRAPESLHRRLESVEGVSIVETRIVETVTIPIETLLEPAVARIVSIPGETASRLNALYLRKGRLVEAGRSDEAVVIESFAEAHQLTLGSSIPVVFNGVLRTIKIVGIAISPEFVFAIGGSQPIQDNKRFGILWMDRNAIAPAFDMDGAFNDVVVKLQPSASKQTVLDEFDRILAPYGGLGSYGRDKQISAQMLHGELTQLANLATVVPFLFLCVAAFLTNVVLSRLVQLQRTHIATLKAVGYTEYEIAIHYLKFVMIIASIGALIGIAVGLWLGQGMLDMYRPFFRFPHFDFQLNLQSIAFSVLLSLGTSILGAWATLRRVARLPPAEAMQPEPPMSYRRSIIERIGIGRLIGPSGKMIIRGFLRRPIRAISSMIGIAFALAIVVSARFAYDAMDALMILQFETSQREDLEITFRKPISNKALRELINLPGVFNVEPLRIAPIRIRSGHASRDTVLIGYTNEGELRRVVEWPPRIVPIPYDGILLTDALANILHVHVGDKVFIEVLEGDRRIRELVVTGIVAEIFGLQVHVSAHTLHHLLDEEANMSSVLVQASKSEIPTLEEQLKKMPLVAAIVQRQSTLAQFHQQSAETTRITSFILTLFGSIIAFGVVYNHARVVLSERSREFASLRVLGFTQREVTNILAGELIVSILFATPFGLWLGREFTYLITSGVDQELYRLPPLVSEQTYAFAFLVTVASALLSFLLIKYKLNKINILEVLKTRD